MVHITLRGGINMKVIYETPEIHKIVFTVEDVITASNGLNEGDEWNKDNIGDYDKIFG